MSFFSLSLSFRCCILRECPREVPRTGQNGPGHQGEATNRNAAHRRHQDEEPPEPLTHKMSGCKSHTQDLESITIECQMYLPVYFYC